jgi:electron transfer flavoprotein alpha subunit
MNDEIIVIAELSDGRVLSVTYEVIAFARAIAAGGSGRVRIVAPGREVQAAARGLADETGMDVLALEDDALELYNTEVWMTALAPWLAVQKPRYICIPHTSRGCDFTPGLAVRLGAACITAVESFRRRDGVTSFTRSIFNGKIRMHVAPLMDMTVLSVLPGAFNAVEELPGEPGSPPLPGIKQGKYSKPFRSTGHVEVLKIQPRPEKSRALGTIPASAQDLDLVLADVIVSAGRGIGAEENLEWIRRLAGLFSKSAVGCSRAVCDLGWLDHKHQVGLTGRTVAPKLYIACGISGAAQHIAGMRGSRFILAINTDPRAAIFQFADAGIVEDLVTFIPLVLEKASKLNFS